MSRATVLGKIRAGLGADPADEGRQSAVTARLAEPPRHLVPARARGSASELAALFKAALAAQGADLIGVALPEQIPGAIARYLRERGLPLRVRAGSNAYLAALPWGETPGLALESGPAEAGDTAGLSHALAGVAETGTLVLTSGPGNPVTLAFLPEAHLIVVEREAIVGSYEDALSRLAARELPRTLNLVSGPSRTGDIGGKIVMGAHGPRRLAVIVVGGAAD
jgi:L-lactate dehydrogenase complex protein LldG